MNDLIDRAEAIRIASGYCHPANIAEELRKLPAVKPEMVKCKKCRYVYYDKEFGDYWCDRMSDFFKVEADGYCKWGK